MGDEDAAQAGQFLEAGRERPRVDEHPRTPVLDQEAGVTQLLQPHEDSFSSELLREAHDALALRRIEPRTVADLGVLHGAIGA